MFSANENILLRQHKKRIVDWVEATIPEESLDMGTTVMVMQVSCKSPGCVPLETAIIIVFPNMGVKELVPGLPESKNGGSYKTKILMPMSEVKADDVLEALPPAFQGGKRTMEKLCVTARDVMLGQITQIFGDGQDESSVNDRQAMTKYLQLCLKQYSDNNCQPPEIGVPFLDLTIDEGQQDEKGTSATPDTTTIQSSGNFVIRRPMDDEGAATTASTPGTAPNVASISAKAKQLSLPGEFRTRTGRSPRDTSSSLQAKTTQPTTYDASISKLFEKEHAPGIRQVGCPCCDPDNPNAIMDKMMTF